MPHDLAHAHPHAPGHARAHNHAHPHDHNHAHPGHLHSHLPEAAAADEIRVLAAQFIDGFVAAADKTSFLRLAGVPFERPDPAGGAPLKLVDVRLESAWQVGAASPSFGTRALSYLPFPGGMVRERTNMTFVYVSLDARADLDLRVFLAMRHGEGG